MPENSHNNMVVAEIWRYPVKSLAGEQINSAEITMNGIKGDRGVLVYDEKKRQLITSRTKPKLLGLKATLSSDGSPLINGLRWDDPESERAIVAAAGESARLIQCDGQVRFDVLPLLVATDGAIKEFG